MAAWKLDRLKFFRESSYGSGLYALEYPCPC
ncbi:hypothetical protein JOC45_003104 [Gordonia hydrophobica]|nr:hypothetical protein [Gordonia hydrophobica]